MTAVGAAAGARAYVGSRRFSWLTPVRLRRITIGLVVAALAGSALLVSGAPRNDGQGAPETAIPETTRGVS